MGKRTMKPRHQDDIRAKIQYDRLIAWLQAGIFGTKFQGKDVTLTSDKVSACKALINKRLPDMSAISTLGKDGQPVDPGGTAPIINMTVSALPAAPKKGNGNGHA